jgi:hypothetical protein
MVDHACWPSSDCALKLLMNDDDGQHAGPKHVVVLYVIEIFLYL